MGILDRWVESLSPAERRQHARTAYALSFIFAAASVMGFVGLLLAARHAGWITRSTRDVEDAVVDVEAATVSVQAALERMSDETAKAQRLAVWVGVGTAVLGAVIGGFAGAFAARLIG